MNVGWRKGKGKGKTFRALKWSRRSLLSGSYLSAACNVCTLCSASLEEAIEEREDDQEFNEIIPNVKHGLSAEEECLEVALLETHHATGRRRKKERDEQEMKENANKHESTIDIW